MLPAPPGGNWQPRLVCDVLLAFRLCRLASTREPVWRPRSPPDLAPARAHSSTGNLSGAHRVPGHSGAQPAGQRLRGVRGNASTS